MQEKKPETAAKNPKKANLLDHHSIKHILDESISEVNQAKEEKENPNLLFLLIDP
jgi:signal peptidase complex subunit 2